VTGVPMMNYRWQSDNFSTQMKHTQIINTTAIPNLKSDKPKIGKSNHHDKANVSLLCFSLCKCHRIQSEGAILPRF
jgi:hypothetical protein